MKERLRRCVPASLWSYLRNKYRARMQGRVFDWYHNVDTSGMLPTTDALTGLAGVEYYGTPAKDLRWMLQLAERSMVDPTQATFIDIGCGKGRALLIASEFPYRRIVGIEFSSGLHAIAQRNISRYRGTARKCSAIELVCCDASRYEFPAEPTVVYMFNPFGGEVMQRVIENLQASLEQHPRPMLIIYHYPVQRALIEALRGIRLIEESNASIFPWCLYAIDSRSMPSSH